MLRIALGVLAALLAPLAPARAQAPDPSAMPGLPKDIEIEFAGQFTRGPDGSYEFHGPVRIEWRDSVIQTDRLTLRSERFLEAEGNVLVVWEGNRIFGRRMDYDLELETGTIVDASGQVQGDYLFWAKRVEKVGSSTVRLDSAVVTTCTQPIPYWSFAVTSATITIDRYARMWNARLRASAVPFLYLPYIVWPVKRERAAGLLFPEFHSTRNRGRAYSQELFVPLGRSADVTLLGRYYTEAGFGGGGELRVVPNALGQASLGGFWIHDKVVDQGRYRATYRQSQSFLNGFRMLADVNWVSDFNYYGDFERDLDLVTSPTILARLEFTRNGAWTSLNARELRREQLFADGTSLVQQTLPELEWRGRSRRLGRTPLYLTYESSVASIQQSGRQGGVDLDADYVRLDAFPTVTLPLSRIPWLEVTPLARYRFTHWTESLDDAAPGGVVSEDLTRVLWGAGLDLVGPKVQRLFRTGRGSTFKHLFEPRIVYGYQEEFDRLSEIPVYDEVDRFTGTGNQATFSVTQRLFAKRPRTRPDVGPHEPAPLLPANASAEPTAASEPDPFEADAPPAPEIDEEAPAEPVEIASLELRQSRSFDGVLSRADLDEDGTSEAESAWSPIELLGRYNPHPALSLDARARYDVLYHSVASVNFSGGVQTDLARLRFSLFHTNALRSGTEDDTQMRLTAGLVLAGGKLRLDADGSLDFDPPPGQDPIPDRRLRVQYSTQCCTIVLEQLVRTFSSAAERDDYYFRVDLRGIGKIFDVSY